MYLMYTIAIPDYIWRLCNKWLTNIYLSNYLSAYLPIYLYILKTMLETAIGNLPQEDEYFISKSSTILLAF